MLKATQSAESADLIVFNGKIATQDDRQSFVTALAVKDGRILAAGSAAEVMRHARGDTLHIDLNGRTVIPGLNDSHLHVIRGGLNFNLELRWDGVSTLAEALRMLRRQVLRTRRSGCASSAAGPNSSSPKSVGRRWPSSTRSRPTRRCS